MRKFMLPAVLMGLGCGSVQAADNGFYLGGSLGQSSIQWTEQAVKFDGAGTAYKIIAGLRPLDWLGVEVNYVDLAAPMIRSGPSTSNQRVRVSLPTRLAFCRSVRLMSLPKRDW